MRSNFQKRSKKIGLSPGSLIHVGSRYTEKSKITLIRYDETFFTEKEISPIAEFRDEKDKQGIA